jgi:hypothetical protein
MSDGERTANDRTTTADLAGEQPDADRPIGRDTEQDDDRAETRLEPLLADDRGDSYRERWYELQARFVDEPRDTVQEADTLVAELLQELARGFNEARSRLEEQWSRGDDVSTEDLRLALQRYRSFFERLLAA